MAMIELTLSAIPSALTRPVLGGEVPVAGVALQAKEARSVNDNSLAMLDLAYDIGEMSLATFTKAREQGVPLVALPLFTGRRFLQGAITLAARAGIGNLSELRGKRVGLPQFWQTSSVWHRLILRQIHGVAQHEVRWVTGAPERMEALHTPPGVGLRLDPGGRSPRELMLAGEIDAYMAPGAGPARPGERDEAVVRAYPDVQAAQRHYYQRTGIFPIMHMIVMKEELAAGHPWLVESLCDAFQQAKQVGGPEVLADSAQVPLAGATAEETRALLGDDPWPYGVRANRHVLETFLKDAFDQSLTERAVAVDDLFASNLPDPYR